MEIKQKKTLKNGKKNFKKSHKNVWKTFAFFFQRRITNVMLDEHEFYVLWTTVYMKIIYPWENCPCFQNEGNVGTS